MSALAAGPAGPARLMRLARRASATEADRMRGQNANEQKPLATRLNEPCKPGRLRQSKR